MAKKKKKNSGRKKSGAPSHQDVQVLMQEQKTAFSAGRGRRASVLGERIFQDPSVDESVRKNAFAAGHEAHLREMLSKGHCDQVRAMTGRLIQNESWLSSFWALSLQLRLGLVEYRDDRNWSERLRAELVDPSDLCGVESGGLGGQAQMILDAWEQVEMGELSAALELLQGVGRRSPLVDWRLFVQALVAIGKNDRAGADSAVKRMLADCPARAAAESLLVGVEESVGFYAQRLKRLSYPGRLKPSDYPLFTGLIKRALAQGRPGFAVTLATVFGMHIEGQSSLNRYYALFERMQTEGFSLKHIYVRMAVIDFPHDAFLRSDTMEDVRKLGWSNPELIRLWLRFFGQAREKWNEFRLELMEWELSEAWESLLFPVLADCRKLVKKLPDFREAYLFWDWVESEGETISLEGIQAYVEAFPEDPDVLELALTRFAEAGEFRKATTYLTQLKRMLKSQEKIEELQQTLLFLRIEDAFEDENDKAVEKLASGYSGQKLQEQIQIAFMRWRVASRGDKRKRGTELAALGSPWLALFFACEYEDGFAVSKFPVAVKRALAEDPDSVLRGYLELQKHNAALVAKVVHEELYTALGKALNHPNVSVELLRPVLSSLLFNIDGSDGIINTTNGWTDAFKTLLAGGADDQALALALRVQMLFLWVGRRLGEDKMERSLRVAWTLAERNETRSVISRVNSKTRALVRGVLKKPATEKMIKAELKMHRKFADLRQLRERYVSLRRAPERFNSFDCDDDDMESVIERLMDKFDSGESCDGNYAACNLCPPEDKTAPDPPPKYAPEPLYRPKSKPYIFSKFIPTMEMEFEGMIEEIHATTSGKHRKTAAETLGEMIGNSSLSDTAKARLWKKQSLLMEGE